MIGRLRHARISAVALALYALAALVVGFAHKPALLPAPLPAPAAELAALARDAGAPLSICHDLDGAPAQQQAGSHICDACALTAAPGLPPASLSATPQRHALELALGFDRDGRFAPARLPAPSSRGPPVV